MLVLPKIVLVGRALKEIYMQRNTPSRISSPPRGLWSSFTWIFFFKRKSDNQQTVIEFANEAQHQHNDTDFKNYTLDEILGDEGIKHQYSAAYTPQQNGVAKRKNRTLIDEARTMMAEFKSPYNFWAEAINTACHATNRLYPRKILNKTPYEILTGKKPNIKYF